MTETILHKTYFKKMMMDLMEIRYSMWKCTLPVCGVDAVQHETAGVLLPAEEGPALQHLVVRPVPGVHMVLSCETLMVIPVPGVHMILSCKACMVIPVPGVHMIFSCKTCMVKPVPGVHMILSCKTFMVIPVPGVHMILSCKTFMVIPGPGVHMILSCTACMVKPSNQLLAFTWFFSARHLWAYQCLAFIF